MPAIVLRAMGLTGYNLKHGLGSARKPSGSKLGVVRLGSSTRLAANRGGAPPMQIALAPSKPSKHKNNAPNKME